MTKEADHIARLTMRLADNTQQTGWHSQAWYVDLWNKMTKKKRRALFLACMQYTQAVSQMPVFDDRSITGIHFTDDLVLTRRGGDSLANVQEAYFTGYKDGKHRGKVCDWMSIFLHMDKTHDVGVQWTDFTAYMSKPMRLLQATSHHD